jgi:integrase/recombinase XerC
MEDFMKSNIEVVKNYLNHKQSLNRKSSSQYEQPLDCFCEWLGKDKSKVTGLTLASVDSKKAQEYILYMKNEVGYSTASIQKHRAILKSLYNYMMMEGKISGSNPFDMTQIPYDMASRTRVKDTVKVDEFEQMLSVARNDIDKCKLALMGIMAFRKIEVVNLKVKDIDFANNTMTILRKGEGNLYQKLPIFKDVKPYLEVAYRDAISKDSEYVFESPVNKGRPITEMSLTKLFNSAKKQCDMENRKVSPHKLRGLGITEVFKKTDLMTASEFANHSSVVVTQRYIEKSGLTDRLQGF